jgi:putative endonuclease
MSKHLELGKKGEEIAMKFLQKKGHEILESNWRHRRSEIDIITKKDGILIFVEVKTRSDDYFGRPESFVTDRKRALMVDAANVYMEQIGHEWEIRFDVIGIIYHNQAHQTIDHFKDAFFPGL